MMIHAGHQNKEIIVAAQCSLNTVITIRHELRFVMEITRLWQEERNIEDDLIAFVQPIFLENMPKIVLDDPSIGIRSLSGELNVSSSTMVLAHNEDVC